MLVYAHLAYDNLITEIEYLRSEVKELRESIRKIAMSNIVDLKEDVIDIKKMMLKRSDTLSSNVKSYSHAVNTAKYNSVKQNKFEAHREKVATSSVSDGLINTARMEINSKKNIDNNCTMSSNNALERTYDVKATSQLYSEARVVNENVGDKWKTVKLRKPDIMKGKKSFTGAFKGVKQTLDVYIGRCEKSVSVSDLVDYIKTELKIEALACDCLSNEIFYLKSFKVTVYAENREIMFNPEMWPEDIIVRRYFRAKQH